MADFYHALVWTSAAVDILAGAAVLLLGLRRLPARTTLQRVLKPIMAAVSVSGAFCAGKAMLMALAGGGKFGAVHVAYVTTSLALPIAGLIVLWAAAPRLHGWSRRLLISGAGLTFIAPLVSGYVSFVEPYWLDVTRTELHVDSMPADADPVRIVVLADIQTDAFGPYEKHWIQQVLSEEPDLILLPGDFFHCWREKWSELRPQFVAMLRSLHAAHGVYACPGNIDNLDDLKGVCKDAGVTLLCDEIVTIPIGRTSVALAGAYDSADPRDATPLMRALTATPADVRLLMHHRPDAVLVDDPQVDVDLILSGHTHGGQVAIPGFGPLVTFSQAPRDICGGGLHTLNGRAIYVSRGVGMERRAAPPLRFFCRPELAVLTLAPPARASLSKAVTEIESACSR